MIRGAIFDLDGTLLNSMHIWEEAGEKYLRSLGIEPKKALREKTKAMSLRQAALYFKSEYGIKLSAEEIENGINAMISHFYMHEAELKKGVREFLSFLYENGVKMCIATATDSFLAEAALNKCSAIHYFSDILTCSFWGHGKTEPIIYREALKKINTLKNKTVVFEDALHAIKTAKNDGFTVAAVYDAFEKNQSKIKELSDFYITDFSDFDNLMKFASEI